MEGGAHALDVCVALTERGDELETMTRVVRVLSGQIAFHLRDGSPHRLDGDRVVRRQHDDPGTLGHGGQVPHVLPDLGVLIEKLVNAQ